MGARRTDEAWLSALLACPSCRGRLTTDGRGPTGLVRCARCGPYPRLAGVPVLVREPWTWCANFRDAILASLAEVDAAAPDAVAVVNAFAERAQGAEPQRFSDDWTSAEAERGVPQRQAKGPLGKVLAEARVRGPGAWIEAEAGAPKVALELGCGAGFTSVRLARRAQRLVVGDVSLRAVLRARARATAAGGDVEAVVLDAHALPFRRGAVELVVAEHVVDLLEAPAEALGEALRVVSSGGRLLLTTSEPSLGTDDEGLVVRLATEVGWAVGRAQDGLVWVREHSNRFVEVYVVQALRLTPRARR